MLPLDVGDKPSTAALLVIRESLEVGLPAGLAAPEIGMLPGVGGVVRGWATDAVAVGVVEGIGTGVEGSEMERFAEAAAGPADEGVKGATSDDGGVFGPEVIGAGVLGADVPDA